MDPHVHCAHGCQLLLCSFVLPHDGENHRVRNGHVWRDPQYRWPHDHRICYFGSPHPIVLWRPHRLVGRQTLPCHRHFNQCHFHVAISCSDELPRAHGCSYHPRLRVRHHVGLCCSRSCARHSPRALRRRHWLLFDDASSCDGCWTIRRDSFNKLVQQLCWHVCMRCSHRSHRCTKFVFARNPPYC